MAIGCVLIVMDLVEYRVCRVPEMSLDLILGSVGSASFLLESDSCHDHRDVLRRDDVEIALLDHGGQCALTGRLLRFFETV